MKNHVFSILLLTMTLLPVSAQLTPEQLSEIDPDWLDMNMTQWATATITEGEVVPTLNEYWTLPTPETGANGLLYWRIEDESYVFQPAGSPYNPITTRYGYRKEEKKLFIYDFETHEERIGFDFTLAAGDSFTTYNGMEWVVEEAKDTLVKMDFPFGVNHEYNMQKRLLKVKSADGKISDQWLEDFGSFSNHLMIKKMEESKRVHTLWVQYAYGQYISREISDDPMYTHDTGWLEHEYLSPDDPLIEYRHAIGLYSANVCYQDGSLVIENLKWVWPMRDYACYYRVDDDLFIAHLWLFTPLVESGEQHWYKDSFCFKGLPAPQSGQYTLHTNPNDKPTGLTRQQALHPARTVIYNLQGREMKSISGEKDFLHELQGLPQGQIYLIDGKKVLWK